MTFLKLITAKINKLYSYRRTLWSMSVKQFKAKYAGSILGFFWVIINPLLMMLVITFVFTAVFVCETYTEISAVGVAIIPFLTGSSPLNFQPEIVSDWFTKSSKDNSPLT